MCEEDPVYCGNALKGDKQGDSQHTEVSPDVLWEHVETGRERITGSVLAVPTGSVGLRFHVPTRLLRKLPSIRLTILARWGREDRQLVSVAPNLLALEQQAEKTF